MRSDAALDQTRDAERERARLAAARSGEDGDGSAGGRDGLALLGIEVVEQALGIEGWHVPSMDARSHPRITGPGTPPR